ncbi:E3 ubiquitin-protein ligase UPL5-like [Typha latifolia]|uniref:E3 ubiquitin-protein ligase UPL5-like n=1 Tax=Typha latifolia TaxID=4733 RepID=UPI003C2DE385
MRGKVWDTGGYNSQLQVDWVSLHELFTELWEAVDENLKKVEDLVDEKSLTDDTYPVKKCSQIASIITRIVWFSQAIGKSMENIHPLILAQRVALNFIFSLARRDRSFEWFLALKDVTHFKARKNLVLILFEERRNNHIYEMSIDRSSLLVNSYELIQSANLNSLRNELQVTFDHEEASGPGVLSEWLCLVCQEIFNPHFGLFSSCQHDKRRFFPNESAMENHDSGYFRFSGRVIALALAYEVQVGILLDHTFFLQLAGEQVTLEDVKVADPLLYSSWKKILDMDAETLDSDALKLTFSRDIESQGSRKNIELVPGGNEIAVSSRNKEQYVDLLVQSHFVTSISNQVTHFALGFADILAESEKKLFFFNCLDLEDLDWMLGGSSNISVMDWKMHTFYEDYSADDDQISWFWEIVEEMSEEQKRELLYFWTAIKYLPVEGFRSLEFKLSIRKYQVPEEHLPNASTCYYILGLPPYRSKSVMAKRLQKYSEVFLLTIGWGSHEKFAPNLLCTKLLVGVYQQPTKKGSRSK